MTEIGAVVPIPTVLLGITFIFTISPSSKPCVVVLAADTLVVNVAVNLSTSPITCSKLVVKLYKWEPIPEIPLPKKYKPSLVLPIPTLVVTIPI